MRNEYAHVSLIGDREENQDRAKVLIANGVSCLIVSDGMGGYEGGGLAAQVTVDSLSDSFLHAQLPLLDPLGFLNLAIGRAHVAVARLGAGVPLPERPRATCAVCLVQHESAYWAHVGDSRVYHLRQGDVIARTRDHSHVEDLVRKGRITAVDARRHPMRHFVEYCLGGTEELTEMTIGRRRSLQAGDVLLLCTDGVWGAFDENDIAHPFRSGAPTDDAVRWLCHTAVTTAAPYSDNSTAAAMLWWR